MCEQIWDLVFFWWRGEFHPVREEKLRVMLTNNGNILNWDACSGILDC